MDMEFLEFKLDGQSFGIDISQVEEISSCQTVTDIPNAHPSLEGVYERRGVTITVINLRNCLGKSPIYDGGEFVVATIDDAEVAFHVDAVMGIHKVDEKNLMKSKVVDDGSIKCLVKIGDVIITILDFDKILSEITGVFPDKED